MDEQTAAVTHRGIIPALVTPFHEDESLDLEALATMVNWVIEQGVHGVFVAGSQGEFYALSHDEHEAIIRQAVNVADGRVPIYAGAGAIATRDAVSLAKRSAAAGADLVTVLPPFFVRPNESELRAHFEAVASAVDIPVVLYNQPQRTGTALSTSLVRLLADVPNIVAIKDSSGSFNQTVDYIESLPDGFAVLVGNDAQIAYGLFAGAAGAIAAGSNVAAAQYVAIYDAVRAGDVEAATEIQRKVARLRQAFDLGTFPVVVKEALAILGRPVGPCRRPVGPLQPGAREQLAQVLADVQAIATQGTVR